MQCHIEKWTDYPRGAWQPATHRRVICRKQPVGINLIGDSFDILTFDMVLRDLYSDALVDASCKKTGIEPLKAKFSDFRRLKNGIFVPPVRSRRRRQNIDVQLEFDGCGLEPDASEEIESETTSADTSSESPRSPDDATSDAPSDITRSSSPVATPPPSPSSTHARHGRRYWQSIVDAARSNANTARQKRKRKKIEKLNI